MRTEAKFIKEPLTSNGLNHSPSPYYRELRSRWYEKSNHQGKESLFVSEKLYDEGARGRILNLYKEIAGKHGVSNPFYNFTDQPNYMPPAVDTVMDENLHAYGSTNVGRRLKVGKIGDYTAEEVALILHEQIGEYVHQKTMGNFPIGIRQKEEELIAAMIGGFTPSDVLISFQLESDNEQLGLRPFAGAKLIFGQHQESISELNGISTASLPTLSAVRVSPTHLNDANHEIATSAEKHYVSATRLFGGEVGVDAYNGSSHALWVICCLAHAARYYSSEDEIRGLIYDTHLEKLESLTTRWFSSITIAQGGDVEATEEVMNSILHYHYEDLKDLIRVVMIPMDEFFAKSEKILKRAKLIT